MAARRVEEDRAGRGIVRGQKVRPEKLARAKELRRQMTVAEELLWRRLRANRLDGYHFRRQQIIDGFIVDFYCHALGLVIEVDGEVHEHQEAYDNQRDEVLRARGLVVLRVANADVEQSIGRVLERIQTAARGRADGEGWA